jgi:hypothetical protein
MALLHQTTKKQDIDILTVLKELWFLILLKRATNLRRDSKPPIAKAIELRYYVFRWNKIALAMQLG